MRRIKFILAMFMAVVIMCGCESSNIELSGSSEGAASCEIYRIEIATQTLKAETTALEGETQEQMVEYAFSKMREKTDESASAVPDGLELNGIMIDSGLLSVDFNSAYSSMTAGEELAFKTATVYTFTSLDFVDYVYITVESNPIQMTNGQYLGKLGREDIVIDGNISAEPTNYEILTLYFKSEDDTGLDTEIREVEVNPNQPIERYVVEQLILGPEDEGLKSMIPTDTKIRDISSADEICYVDLSGEFVSKQTGTDSDAVAAVYCIVNSLGELEDVTRVQFLIDGEKIDNYNNIMDFSMPIEPDYNISFE